MEKKGNRSFKCAQCGKVTHTSVEYNMKMFCCGVCCDKYKKQHKPKICDFC